ncbi:hypothetical protein L873DRAFT_1801719 [Choiromyces venosus 120613-1]|uniref:Uncharacterized protein n=1 Tax=Choiromyces venosus 120613-1 TaxID=1336337 RepID=A0A3N4JWJ8_9PEZI|nr:hypothetical protein L873DRAFT_1801719 [Choiromyces venosus 120613-1]
MARCSPLFMELHHLLLIAQSHRAIPDRAEPDSLLNHTESLEPLSRHRISLIEQKKRTFRVRRIFLKTLPWSL